MNDFLFTLYPLFLLVLTWVSERIARLLSEKIKNERVQALLARVETEAFSVVREVAQTFADGLRKDGSFNQSAAEKAKAMALQKLKNRLGPLAGEQLQQLLHLDEKTSENLLQGRIESVVHVLKEAKPITLESQ